MSSKLLAVLGAVFVSLGFTGCASGPSPRAYNVKLTVDKSLSDTSVQVDLIGANKVADLPKLESYSVTEYWQPGNTFRRDADKVALEFGGGRPAQQALAALDAKWATWLKSGSMYLVILADLPGISADRAGNADPRRLILPLDRAEWPKGTETIEVLVQESGLRLSTAKKQ